MRNTIKYLLIMFLLGTSCSDSFDPLEVEQWQLSSTFAYMTGTEVSASDLGITEQLFFEERGKFVKIREREDEITSAEGVWQEFTQNGETGYLVTYPEDNLLVFNCSGTPEEFYFQRDGLLIQASGTPCDGPEYRYVTLD